MHVNDFIAQEYAKPFEWGETDCCTLVDKWVEINTGQSLLAVHGRRASREWLEESGGNLLKVASGILDAGGLDRTRKPQSGDVGFIQFGVFIGMAIFDGKFWFSKNEDGAFASKEIKLLRAWKIDGRN